MLNLYAEMDELKGKLHHDRHASGLTHNFLWSYTQTWNAPFLRILLRKYNYDLYMGRKRVFCAP